MGGRLVKCVMAGILIFLPVSLADHSDALARGGSPTGGDARLPNLVVFPPLDIYIDSCNPYERVEAGAQRCLRYDTSVANFGKGALELRYRVDQAATEQSLVQRIYQADGNYIDRVAGRYEFHPAHAHFHYADFAQALLWRSNARGERIGKAPIRTTKKNGFCIYDLENYWVGRRDSEDRRYRSDEACRPNEVAAGDVSQVNGLSRGWMDIYQSELADQYVEVSGIPDGYYVLEVTVDPDGTLEELKKGDNSVTVLLKLQGDRVGYSRADVAGDKEDRARPLPVV